MSEELEIKPLKKIIIRRKIPKDITKESVEEIKPERGKCIHGKNVNGYYCRECPGKGICEHNIRRDICVPCGGSQVCEHKKVRCRCVLCGGSSICKHRKVKDKCIPCGGSQVCEHKKLRCRCVLCGGSSICEHKKRRDQCKNCNSPSICEHRVSKAGCKICRGSSICNHNDYKNRCKECRRALPLEVSLTRYKHACIICGASLFSNRQKEYRLCSDHLDDSVYKRIEHVVRDIITDILNFPPSTADEPVYTDKCVSSKYRPDIAYHTEDLIIIIEVDEDSHCSYDPDCEIKRLVNMKDAYPNQKLLVLRINPDTCRSLPFQIEDTVDRTHFLSEVLLQYLNDKDYYEELDERVTNVAYFFYGQGGRKHIDKTSEEIDKVKLLDDYHCD